MNNFDLCRKNLCSRLNIDTTKKRDPVKMQLEIFGMTTKLDEIIELAKPRLIMGGIRYGSEWEHVPLMKYMQEKFNQYKENGNFEFLIDFTNFIAIEGVLKTHPKHHFNPLDRK